MMPSPEGVAKALRPPLLKVFPAALLGRLVVIPYYPLSDVMLKLITAGSSSAGRKGQQKKGYRQDDAVVDRSPAAAPNLRVVVGWLRTGPRPCCREISCQLPATRLMGIYL